MMTLTFNFESSRIRFMRPNDQILKYMLVNLWITALSIWWTLKDQIDSIFVIRSSWDISMVTNLYSYNILNDISILPWSSRPTDSLGGISPTYKAQQVETHPNRAVKKGLESFLSAWTKTNNLLRNNRSK